MCNTLRKKIGQLMVFGFSAKAPSLLSEEIKELIENQHVGGILLFSRNIGTPEEVIALTSTLQASAKKADHEHPLFICIDQENGVVRRLGEGTTIFPGAMLLGATGDPKLAFEIGRATGHELFTLGINWNLAPVLDVNNNPYNPVIDVRSFGEDPDQVAEFGKQMMWGLQKAGVIATLKHFPGHGDTTLDSHLELPVIPHNLQRLNEIELVPFKAGIQCGADTVMTSHVYFPSLEPEANRPATMSKPVITGLLRESLGFDGVVTTDCMEMAAIASQFGTARGAVEAIKAGVDVIMVSHLPSLQQETIEAIYQAVRTGELKEQRIDDAYHRVLALKKRTLVWRSNPPPFQRLAKHQVLARNVMAQGITVLENKAGVLPLSTGPTHRVLVVYPENTSLTQVEDKWYPSGSLGSLVRERHPDAKVMAFSMHPKAKEFHDIQIQVHQADTIIVGTWSATRAHAQKRLVKHILSTARQAILIAMRSPYDLGLFPEADVAVATYEYSTPVLRLAVGALFGTETVGGTLPITIKNNDKSNTE